MNQIQNSKQLAHIGEEVEEHQEIEAPIKKTETETREIVDIGPYFAGAIIGLAIIVFLIFKFLRKNRK